MLFLWNTFARRWLVATRVLLKESLQQGWGRDKPRLRSGILSPWRKGNLLGGPQKMMIHLDWEDMFIYIYSIYITLFWIGQMDDQWVCSKLVRDKIDLRWSEQVEWCCCFRTLQTSFVSSQISSSLTRIELCVSTSKNPLQGGMASAVCDLQHVYMFAPVHVRCVRLIFV